jgi:two-component system nitrate/nitrite response regulator NarL
LSAAVISADPLARSGLRAALDQSDQLTVARTLHPDEVPDETPALRGVDALLWDLGLLGEPSFSAESLPAPTLVLARDAEDARDAMDSGARGALRRDASPEQLFAALSAAAEGLWVMDAGFGASLWPARGPSPGLPEPLSPRELEVTALLVEGLPNRAIAARLFISAHTVKFHVNAILSKLDAATRTEAAVSAVRLGLVSL